MKLIEYRGEVLSGYVPDLPKRYFRKIIIMNKLIRASIKLVGALFVCALRRTSLMGESP